MNTNNRRGMVTMLIAIGLLSVMDMGLKLLAQHYPPIQVAALRGLASWPLVLVWVLATTGLRPLLRARWPLHVLRICIGIGMMTTFIFAIRDLPLTTAYTLFFIAPLLITALSGPLLGEQVGLRCVKIADAVDERALTLNPKSLLRGALQSLTLTLIRYSWGSRSTPAASEVIVHLRR